MKFQEKQKNIRVLRLHHEEYYNSFVYFLLDNDEVVYVGQTKIGISRPLSHIKDKIFDTIKMIPCPSDSLNEMEGKYILKYKPKYNKEIAHLSYQSLKNIKLKLLKNNNIRTNLWEIRKIVRNMNFEVFDYNGLQYLNEKDANFIKSYYVNKNVEI